MGTLATEIRERLGPAPELDDSPLVSIVVLNRDGLDHLRRLVEGLRERTDYPRIELIVVDNGSSDGSLEFLRSVDVPFPLAIRANPHNESFSDANNQGAQVATGELLLFLNNDIEPFEPGWLRELVACHRASGAGIVGATLITPEGAEDTETGYRVQTRRVRLRGASDKLWVDPAGGRRELFSEGFGEDVETALAIGPCILIEPALFHRIGGFTHGYFYGGEDIDLFLKVHAEGLGFLYSGRSVLIHGSSVTRRKLVGEGRSVFAEDGNSRLLWGRWGPRVWREYELDRLAGGGLWAVPGQDVGPDPPTPADVEALGFVLRLDGVGDAQRVAAEALEDCLGRRGHRHLTLEEAAEAPERTLCYDVAVYPQGSRRHLPEPGQLNVLWVVDGTDPPAALECQSYDLVVAGDPGRRADDLVDLVLGHAERSDHPTRVAP